MKGASAGERQGLNPGILIPVLLLTLCTLAAAPFLRIFQTGSESQLEKDLIALFSVDSPGEGRLFHAILPASPPAPDAAARAQIALLAMSDGPLRQRLQNLLFLSRKDWPGAIGGLEILTRRYPDNPEFLNDLGVAYMATGQEDPINYFKALLTVEKAAQLAPSSRAPRFNLILLYRAVGLVALEATARQNYLQNEPNTNWIQRMLPAPPDDAASLLKVLDTALRTDNPSAAQQLYRKHRSFYWQTAMDFALAPTPSASSALIAEFVARQARIENQDETIQALLDPLLTDARDAVLKARRSTQQGIALFAQDNVPRLLDAYQAALGALEGVHSPIDHLWVGLNLADAYNRAGNTVGARQLLGTAIADSRKLHYKWILGKALTVSGSNAALANDYLGHLGVLSEASALLSGIGATQDTARPAYYTAMAHATAGDLEGSLRYVLDSLRATRPDDHVRLTQLDWLASLLLFRLGYHDHVATFQEQSVREALLTGSDSVVTSAVGTSAGTYDLLGRYDEAAQALAGARTSVARVQTPLQKSLITFNLNLLCGRINLHLGHRSDAKRCLEDNLRLATLVPRPLNLYSATLQLLAEIYEAEGDLSSARRVLEKAIQGVEADDLYIATERLRLAFDNERRSLFDSAIGLEYRHGNSSGAWNYVQRYQSKLFLELMGQVNPRVSQIRAETVNQEAAQRQVPANLQVVEYILLRDRLLIWVLSDKVFTSVEVPRDRDSLEKAAVAFVENLKDRKDVTLESQDLFDTLIQPIRAVLDPSRAVAIVPDLSLHRLPFAALLDGTTGHYMVDDFTIMESPSLTNLLVGEASVPARTPAVAFGTQADDTASIRELNALKKLYPGITSFTGAGAEKRAFLSAMDSAAIFHYAGHSVDASDPVRSSILLNGDQIGPNSITALDISQQRMKANSVVVLASCDSSVGNSRDGVGMRGLTSAFLIGGAGSVVGSLWPVEANATLQLMVDFHQLFASGKLPVALALRKAQLALLHSSAERAHPYYWSGFVVTGNDSALR